MASTIPRRQGVYRHDNWSPAEYPLLGSDYKYTIRDVFVDATLTETFRAQTLVKREISYLFEIPPGASVVEFSARVGDTSVEGIVEEKKEASNKYQQAKSRGAQAWKLDKVNDEGILFPNPLLFVTEMITNLSSYL